ncbi:MAG: class I SAM-dependent methyltransferase [Acidobacteriota bacterium]|jgi:ubiquinone/menaquinone biosynthesis C-methylase UbiE
MEAAEYVRMAAVQDRHWWFEAKRRTVATLLARHAPELRVSTAAQRVLEVGPGTGSMIEVMTRYGSVYAADAYLPALRLLIEHRPAAAEVTPVGADLLELPFTDAGFALVGCFDVLYHQRVGNVSAALGELHRVCAPGGYLAITDSAFPILRSSHDVATHAARRFRLPDLIVPLRSAGFEVAHATYFHALLFPAALAVRLGKRALHGSPELTAADGEVEGHSDLAPVAGWLNTLLLSLYRVETPLAVRLRLPFGSSLMILARRPN